MGIQRALRALALHRAASSRVIRLAYPIVLASLSYTLIGVVDTVFLGRLGATSLAASGVAAVLFFAISFPLSGTSIGVQTLVARRFGEGGFRECGRVAGSGLILAMLVGIPLSASYPWLARLLAPLLSNDPAVIALGTDYLAYRLLGSAFFLVNWTLQGFFSGIGETRHQLVASIMMTVVNIVLDALLIFGYWGFPKLGVRGAAIASTIGIALVTVYYVSIALTPRIRTTYGVIRSAFSRPVWLRQIVRLAAFVTLQRLISNGSWFAFFGIVARIGTVELAASNVIRSIYSLPIMIAVGLGTALAALVGQNLGAKRPEKAEVLAWEAARLAAYAMGLIGLLFVIAPQWLLRLYTPDAAVVSAGSLPLRMIGGAQLFAGIALVLSQSLQGAGNTRFVMLVELGICSIIYLPVVYVLGIRFGLGIVGAWMVDSLYWIVLSTIMVWRFRSGKWKAIVV